MSTPRFRSVVGALLVSLASPPAIADAPRGWVLAGSRPQQYVTGTTATAPVHGRASAYLASTVERTDGFGTLMQSVSADAFRGRRVRLSANVKLDDVGGWAGVWMRVDGPGGRPLVLDNMHARALRGSADWQRHAVVLDVAPDATAIAFGVLLDGSGRVLVDDFRLEVVDASVPVTAVPLAADAATARLPATPANPDFEE